VHDQSVTSIGIDLAVSSHGTVDLGLYNKWLDGLLRDKGADLFRMKGVLAVKGVEDKYAFHAVRGGAGRDDLGRKRLSALGEQETTRGTRHRSCRCT